MAYAISKVCTKCGACVIECPTSAIFEAEKQFIIDSDTCLDHAACVSVCPVNAISPKPVLDLTAGDAEEEDGEEEEG